MPISVAQFIALQERVLRNSKRNTETVPDLSNAAESEKDLHYQIMDFCANQWPRWKVIHARMDKRTTLDLGVPDFCILMPNGRTLFIEAKSGSGKLTPEQQAWHKEAEMIGHFIFVVRSMDQFMQLVEPMDSKNPALTGNAG